MAEDSSIGMRGVQRNRHLKIPRDGGGVDLLGADGD